MTVLRNGRENVFDMDAARTRWQHGGARCAATRAVSALGAELAKAGSEELRALKLEHGVKETAVKRRQVPQQRHPRRLHHLRIDQEAVRTPEDVQRVLASKKAGCWWRALYPTGSVPTTAWACEPADHQPLAPTAWPPPCPEGAGAYLRWPVPEEQLPPGVPNPAWNQPFKRRLPVASRMRQLKITKSITNREASRWTKYLQEIGKEGLITAAQEVETGPAHQGR